LLAFSSICLFFKAWVNARTDNGESCLHLTGIYGHSQVTLLLLQKGADPNIRSTYEAGLRMHPLSWNVYGGHVENIELLLKYGADVNLDFDGMNGNPVVAVTALDVTLQLQQNEKGDDRFTKMEQVLRSHGGKTTVELKQQHVDEL
jgi:ankyrin repeat protein